MAAASPAPPPAEQKARVEALASPLQHGARCFLVAWDWWIKWQLWCDFQGANEATDKHDSGQLKSNMLENMHYTIVNEPTWALFKDWYSAGPEIARNVIATGRAQTLVVEVYPVTLQLIPGPQGKDYWPLAVSKSSTVKDLFARIAETMFIPPYRMYVKVDMSRAGEWKTLSRTGATIEEQGLVEGVRICACASDDENPDEIFSTKPEAMDMDAVFESDSEDESSTTLKHTYPRPAPSFVSRYDTRNSSSYSSRSTITNGAVGLNNLGNTCFMNSALQCLSHTNPLTEYFLQDRHKSEINRNNPLGTGGKLAEVFGELLNSLWRTNHYAVYPSAFKSILERFAPQFSGYRQHDSQELLGFLLDGLHEDLNLVQAKPYTKMVEAEGRLDNEVAREAWDVHLLRNQSLIVDIFQGQLKSTVTCPSPDCRNVSVTFDPFMYLSLPLPSSENLTTVTLFQVHGEPANVAVKRAIKIDKHKTAEDLGELLSEQVDHFAAVFVQWPPFMKLQKVRYETTVAALSNSTTKLFALTTDYSRSIQILVANKVKNYTYGGLFEFIGRPHLITVVPDSGDEEKCLVTADELYHAVAVGLGLPNASAMTATEIREYFNLKREVLYSMESVKPDASEISITDLDTYIVQWEDSSEYERVVGEVKVVEDESVRALTAVKCDTGLTLDDCLKAFVSPEQLGKDDEWYCGKCKSFQRATKKFDLWRLPQVLVVHLKRFKYGQFSRQKVTTYVDFPINGLDLSEYVLPAALHGQPPPTYDLFAVSDHSGGMGGGHYMAYARSKTDEWHCYNDAQVRPCAPGACQTAGAYLLFYERVATNGGARHDA